MIANPAVGWLLSALFSLTGLVAIVGAVRARRGADRVSYVAHALMSLAMVLMPWPAWSAVPAIVPILVFSAAALWYLFLALFRRDVEAGPGDGHGHGPLLLGYHVAMMAAMVWMVVVMASMASMGGHMHGMSDSMSMWALPAWQLGLSLAATAFFALAAVWFLVRMLQPPVRGRHGALPAVIEELVSLGMAVGMAASFLLMS